MILTRDELKELYSTGSVEVVVAKPPAKTTQSVQTRVGAPAVCIVGVADGWPHRSGAHVVLLELARRLKPGPARTRTKRERIRLLKRGHGETADPRSAMRDPEITWDEEAGPAAEPEMVDEVTERRFAHLAHRSDELRHLDKQRRELTERLDRTLEGAERLGVDPTRHLAAIERRISDLEKKLKKAA